VSGGAHDVAAASLAGLYRDAIRHHAANPVGYRRPIAATHRHETYNPLCGDRIEVSLRIAGDAVAEAAFDGEACAICMASASLLCSLAPGRAVAELRQLSDDLHRALNGAVGAGLARDLESLTSRAQSALPQTGLPEVLQPLLGVRPYPSRIRCATLPWAAAVSALADGCPESPD
jgi:nitrogen fixation NifU-like protein